MDIKKGHVMPPFSLMFSENYLALK